jgi:multidrug/hemolysin transport system permease protein
VFFSLMGVLIVVLLYLLFLRNMLIETYPDLPGIGNLVDVWVMSGILGIVPVTTCAGALQTMVEDRTCGRDRDLLVSPIGAHSIALGYVLSTFAVGLIMGAATLAICLVYLVATGCPLSVGGVLTAVLLMVPSALSASIVMYALTTFIRSTGAFSGLFTVISVMIGFLAGIYMPMGTMPAAMQVVGTLVPASHMAALFRDGLAQDALEQTFQGASPEVLSQFRYDMGFDLHLRDFSFDEVTMLIYVMIVTVAFFALASARIRR